MIKQNRKSKNIIKFSVFKNCTKTYCIILLLLLVSFSLKAQNVSPTSIKVFSVNIYTTTIVSVSCLDFLNAFQNILRTDIINDSDSIRVLEALLKQAKYSRKQRNIDVRVKVFLEESTTKSVEICSDGFADITINGQLIKKNKTLLAFIRSVMPRDNIIFGRANKLPSGK